MYKKIRSICLLALLRIYMVEELLIRLENLRDKEVSLVELDGIFGEYDWDCMGFSVKPKMKKQTDKFEKLIYIECPMG